MAVLRRRTLRRFVLPVLAWEGAAYFMDAIFLALRVRVGEFLLPLSTQEQELIWALEEIKVTKEELELQSFMTPELQRRVDEYVSKRALWTEYPEP